MKFPTSPTVLTESLCYFARMCDKIRLYEAGELPQEYHKNLGRAMDLWTCQLLEVDYGALAAEVKSGSTDEEVLQWAFKTGKKPQEHEILWWNAYMSKKGFQDDLSEKLTLRIKESGFEERGIQTFFEYIDADEERN